MRRRLPEETSFPVDLAPFREHSLDAYVWRSVFRLNEYLAPRQFTKEDTVIDIGLHIGSFSALALTRGAGSVHGYEADRHNFEIAQYNLRSFAAQTHLHNVAVCGIAEENIQMYASPYPVLANGFCNTGGSQVHKDALGPPIPTRTIATVLNLATDQQVKRIRLLKIDCEGSEYAILADPSVLTCVDEIVGELHFPPPLPFRTEDFIERLSENGFDLRIAQRSSGLAHFWAFNRAYLR